MNQIVNPQTTSKIISYQDRNNKITRKILRIKDFAPEKILKHKNNLFHKLTICKQSNRIWLEIWNPISLFFYSAGIYIAQGFLMLAIPFLRLKEVWNIRSCYNNF